MIDPALGGEDYCYVSTTGRVTGRPHEIEIWFALEGDTIYILAGGGHGSDWVKNGKRQPRVGVRIAGRRFEGRLRIVVEAAEDARARELLLAKYAPSNDDLDEWGRTALAVAIDLAEEGGSGG